MLVTLAEYPRPNRITAGQRIQGSSPNRLRPSETRLRSRVELEYLDLDVIADGHYLGRMLDPSPSHVGDVQQAINTAKVEEGTIVGEILTTPSTI